jgi:hypothetical protein
LLWLQSSGIEGGGERWVGRTLTLEALPTLTDATSGRQYIYDLPTLDDPTRPNENGIIDPDETGYTGVDVNDPWGGNDGLNQAMVVDGGPVQIFSGGYRNTYDLVVTEAGRVYCTDNGANGGWGGLPVNEGNDGTVTNDYDPSEPGSTDPMGGEQVNNKDHLTLITGDIQNYTFGSFYGGHPTPVRANPTGAGLFTNPTVNDNINSVFRTLIYDPDGSRGAGYTTDPNIALPANWPPVPPSLADPREGDWRGPGISNPDGPDDVLVTVWGTNTNGIDEYTASNFGGAMKGDLLAGKNGGVIRRVELNANGGLEKLTSSFISNLGGNALGITCNGDSDPFPGTVWIATFNSTIKVLEPQDLVACILPGQAGYSATGDNDADGYTNQDEIDNKNDEQSEEDVICNGGSQPDDFDKSAGGSLVSDLNDPDDDNDNVPDADDPFQLGDPTTAGSDAFNLPVLNDLFSDNQDLKGYLGLGFTGLMNNGDANPNWLNWLDRRDDPNEPNPNDILGGAVGAMTMQMTAGTALGTANSQEKAFQYGVNVDQSTGAFSVEGRLFNFTNPLQLYGTSAPGSGEVGLFIGDGTQSNYIKLVLTGDGNVLALQEVNDVPQTPVTAAVTASGEMVFYFQVDASTGTVTLQYAADGGSIQTLGTLTAEGSVLAAIQNSNTPLAVGLIGTSNEQGKEVEGTWDYLYVQPTQPFVQQTLPDVEVVVGASDLIIDLVDYFGDNGGDDNLTFTVETNTNTAVGTSISGSTLTLSFPATPVVAELTIRATDNSSLTVDQTFSVAVADDPIPILRIRANGATLAATDAPNPDWVGILAGGAQSGSFNGLNYAVNTGKLSTQNTAQRHSSLPDYVPQALFAKERYDVVSDPPMEWTISLPNGNYFVRLYLGNGFSGTSEVGERVFDISIEGQLVQNDLDLVAAFGHQTGGMLEYPVALSDGTLNILFAHVTENPLINGIEILSVNGQVTPPLAVVPIPNQSNVEGDLINLTVMSSGGDANETFSYSATGLPPGIQVEPTTGLVFGNIAAGASTGSVYTSVITVSKPSSVPVTETFTWTVSAPIVDATWNEQTDDENYTARHECSFVQAGDKFYLFGGRENATTLDVYDYQSKTWSQIANSAPAEFNHFQAVEYQGLIWVIGAFKTNAFPNEVPADYVWSYNPATDEWTQGPEVPTGRKRGSAGLVMYNDKFYVVTGNTDGHDGGYIPWFDEFDPATGTWTALADAPRPRDHFHATVVGNKLYVAGGRLSGGTGGVFAPLIAEVDVYDFTTQTWSTVADLPTPRAAAAVATFENEVYVIGGEIGVDLSGTTVNDAVKTTEAFDPVAGTWSTKADLITERHGTQAIVSGNGIHLTAGSSTKGGGGKMKNMEFFGTDNPAGAPLTSSQLQVPATVNIGENSTSDVRLSSVGGNTGIIITDVAITGPDAASYSLDAPVDFTLLKPGSNLEIPISFSGLAGETATLSINYGEASTATVALNGSVPPPAAVVYRINAGGPLTPTNDSKPVNWDTDQSAADANGTASLGTPSPYINLTAPAKDITFGATFSGANTTGYPDALFATERYSDVSNPNNMQWDFPVANGDYTVNLLFAEVWTGAQSIGVRVFDVLIEGNLVLDKFDQTEAYGWNTAGVASIPVTVTDENLDIDFLKIAQNPSIKGIEIISGSTIPINNSPVVDNPGEQFGTEGDIVTLQVIATDDDPCSGLTYEATGLPSGLSINSNTGLISGTLEVGTGGGPGGAFVESGGLVVIEAESIESLPGSWKDASIYSNTFSPNVNSPDDATGSNFIVWEGGQSLGNPGNGLLTYPVEITTPGVYRFQWRSQVGKGTNATEHNDTWVKIESDAFYGLKSTGTVCPKGLNSAENDCTGGSPEGAGAGGWFKVYSSGANSWKWSTNTSDNDAHQIYARFDNPGTYNIFLSARSSSHIIDRMVLSHSSYSGNPQNLNLPESQKSPVGSVGAAAGSPYSVVVTVSDGCTPSFSNSAAFTWNVSDQQSAGSLTMTAASQGRTDHGGTHTVEMYGLANLLTPLYTYTATADASGQMTVSGFTPGEYKVLIKRAGYLQRVKQMTLTGGNSVTSFDQLKAGNLNDDAVINIQDFSLLATAFGQSGHVSDINGDGVTNIQDFSLLGSNFGESGDSLTDNQ